MLLENNNFAVYFVNLKLRREGKVTKLTESKVEIGL